MLHRYRVSNLRIVFEQDVLQRNCPLVSGPDQHLTDRPRYPVIHPLELGAHGVARCAACRFVGPDCFQPDHGSRQGVTALPEQAQLEVCPIAEVELAAEGEAPWTRVDEMIATKKTSEYDQAVALLRDLRALGKCRGDEAAFATRVLELRAQYPGRPGLQDRLDKADLPRLQRLAGLSGRRPGR